ncbi:hypothetical protein PF008_g32200, partial [Phytophthora fragariae]
HKADEAWLDATTDSVDDYAAVDSSGVTDRKHVASESLDGCDQRGRREWAYIRVARDGVKDGTQFVHGR